VTPQINRAELKSRYIFKGILTMETPLHIGTGGEVSTLTDSPILSDAAGRPIIPGSSFKGAFRTAVERLAPLLGDNLRSCHLDDEDPTCVSAQNSLLSKDYQRIRNYLGRAIPANGGTNDDEAARESIARFEAAQPSFAIPTNKPITENDHILPLLERYLCHTCQLFGSPHLAAKTYFDDLRIDPETWFEITEIRDGVGIDRDSERAVPNIKYDYEVVPGQTRFHFGLTVENPTELELGLVAVGLQEFSQGMIRLGGIKSRGLGKCRLELTEVQYMEGKSGLVDYLRSGKLKSIDAVKPVAEFVQSKLAVFTRQESGHAETIIK
jgi:CRISPR/Cas system CSM-associated protein Csm3 (group 7 of RAMP superfamily)